MSDRLRRLSEVAAEAVRFAPAFAKRLNDAGLAAGDLADAGSLNGLPVLKKEVLMQMQAEDPPFAGFLACPMEDVDQVFASPGPIFEPMLKGDETGNGFDLMFRSAGLGPSDIALNTWSYHLVPAGLLFAQGVRSVGATVIPSGPGQTDVQVQLVATLGATAFMGSTAYFETVAAAYAERFGGTSGHWRLTRAFLGGEPGDWMGKRRRLEQEHGITTHGCYGTADLGLVGYEKTDLPGYSVHPDRLVQICDPASGSPLPPGMPGEIVVSTLTRGWPMIRFGTGDLARALSHGADGFVDRLGPVEGRVGAAVKIREIFVYPAHLSGLAAQVSGVDGARLQVTRRGNRDYIRIEVLGNGFSEEQLREVFTGITRLKADDVVSVEAFSIEQAIVDAREL